MYNAITTIDNGNMERVFAIQSEYGSVIEKTELGNTQLENDTVKDTLKKYIYIDLEKMMASTVLESATGTKIIASYYVVSKGKPNSYYETPVGSYQVKSKEYKHFSSLGGVYMPYSMQFYGNFFIHGIPYHPDGTRVSRPF